MSETATPRRTAVRGVSSLERALAWIAGVPAVGISACGAPSYALLATLMWLPFGLRTTGLVEEWGLLGLHDRGEQLWWLTEGSSLESLRLRPLFVAPFELRFSLGAAFVWLNVIALL